MTNKDLLSRTMRIDLIPNVPSRPVGDGHKRVVIADSSSDLTPEIDGVAERDAVNGSARYEELFQSVYDAAIITDLNGIIIDANVRAVEFLLYERMELCGLAIHDIISGADDSLIATLIDNLDEKRFTIIQAYCERKDKTLFPGEIAVNKLRLGSLHLCFFIRDITIRKHAEEMLVTEHNAIQNAINGIAIIDIKLELEYSNPAFAKMLGYDNADMLVDHDVRDFFEDYKDSGRHFLAVVEKGENWVKELKAIKKDNTTFDVQVSAACNRNSDGDIVGVVFSAIDITDRKRIEEVERQSEHHRVMLESFGAACHHLGQPATILLANLSFLKTKLEDSPDSVKEVVESCVTQMNRLGEILHRLNSVNEYRTTQYLSSIDDDDEGVEQSRIIEI